MKEELRGELRDELATKADLARIDTRFEKMDKKFTIYFMAIIFTVIATNHDSITLLGKILGLVK